MPYLERIAGFPVPTLPGWRHWYDICIHAGWRIQKHELKGAYRLVSPAGRKWPENSEQACLERLEKHKDKGLKWKSDHLVLIVPGLNNVLITFSTIEKTLKENGYAAMTWHFSSNRTDTRGHARRLRDVVSRLENVKKVSFVTHSLGGLILRTMLAEDNPWHDRFELGEIVMISPPHKGSFVADFAVEKLKWDGLFQWVTGHVGHDLTTAGAASLPPLRLPVGIIVGGTGGKLGFNLMAGTDNDSTVSIESSRVELMADFIQIPGWSHTLILWNQNAADQIVHFIEQGKFK